MHGHVDQREFLSHISGFSGTYYILLALMNGVAALYLWKSGRSRPCCGVSTAMIWLLVSVLCVIFAPLAYTGNPDLMLFISLPAVLRNGVNAMMNPTVYTLGSLVGLSILFVGRRFYTQPVVAWGMFNLALLLMGFSITDVNFAQIVTKADNVPIVGMVFLLGFFTWLGAYKAVQNDDRIARGLEPLEKEDSEKVLVWPDLVYTELICMIALTAILLLWGIGLQAPLGEPASSVKTPNPSKAPWYFLGLQEMLVYYDPWMAGVVLPSMVIAGLMAIPYLDFNKLGNGYYTIAQRKFAYLTFQFGFLVLWVTLIVMGTFLRGPNWNFFGPYETWDVHKVEALNNVDLSERFWIDLLHQARPKAPDGSGVAKTVGYVLVRESPGILALAIYFGLLPPAMVVYSRFFRGMFLKMGFVRYMVMTNLLLTMGLLPLKMLARWTINMKYFVAIPEYFFNF